MTANFAISIETGLDLGIHDLREGIRDVQTFGGNKTKFSTSNS